MVSTILLKALYHGNLIAPGIDGHVLYSAYFYTYWISYFAGCVILFLALQGLFRYAMSSLPGLSSLGLIGFRWAAVVSFLVAVATVVTSYTQIQQSARVTFLFTEVAASLCVLELGLLVFLVMSIRALHVDRRNRIFGILAGFAAMASVNLIVFAEHSANLYSWQNQTSDLAAIAALVIWIGYLAMPEPVRKQASAPIIPAALVRWNDLAGELGPHAPQAATQQSGFLQNVESVVDRVLAKNSMNAS
jgi:drug/metabolite transporter (DMT)-like permease